MIELISRQSLLNKYDAEHKGPPGRARRLIEEEPTVEERKRGEWIPEFDGKFTGGAYWFSCSECKRIVPEVRNGGWNFCPNCGADMRGEIR